jgi:hypothetical protein
LAVLSELENSRHKLVQLRRLLRLPVSVGKKIKPSLDRSKSSWISSYVKSVKSTRSRDRLTSRS